MSERNVSGWLAGTAAAITAVGGLIAILAQVGVIGGDDGESDGTTGTGRSTVVQQPREDWAAQANQICETASDDIDALPEPETVDPMHLTEPMREALDIGQRQLRELQKLVPPDNDAPKVKRLLRLYAQTNEALEELIAALRVGDVTNVQPRADQMKRYGAASDRLATQLNATTCAEGASLVGTDLGAGGTPPS